MIATETIVRMRSRPPADARAALEAHSRFELSQLRLPDLLSGMATPSPLGQRLSWRASLAAAATAHALVLFVLVYAPAVAFVGAGGVEREVILVEIVTAAMLDVGSDLPQQPTRPAVPDEARHAEHKERVLERVSEQPNLVLRDPGPDEKRPDPEAITTANADDPSAEATSNQPEEPTEPRNLTSGSASPEQTRSDSAGLEATHVRQNKEAPGSAVAGFASLYARTVLSILAQRKPRATAGIRGTVRIVFTVTPAGEVGGAQVARASGHRVLDEAALAAVRAARFPPPPANLEPYQRSYEVPYIFR